MRTCSYIMTYANTGSLDVYIVSVTISLVTEVAFNTTFPSIIWRYHETFAIGRLGSR